MLFKQVPAPAAGAYVQGTGTTSVALVIPPPPPNQATVLDHILGTTINGTSGQALTIDVNGTIFARKTITGTVADFIDTDLSGGWPVLKTQGDDGEVFKFVDSYKAAATSSFGVQGGVAGSGETVQAVGMSFTTTQAYTITGVTLRMFTIGTPTDNLFMELAQTSITTAASATSALVPASSIFRAATSGAGLSQVVDTHFTFTTPFALSNATKYFLRIFRDGPRDTVNVARIGVTASSGYSGGGTFTLDNTVWSSESATIDAMFVTDAGVTLTLTAPASSTGSTLTATYHYGTPSEMRR